MRLCEIELKNHMTTNLIYVEYNYDDEFMI